MSARPRITESPFSASLTVILHISLSLAANEVVNFSGICCTMIIPGESRGNALRKVVSASVPPVDAPTATTYSVVLIMLILGDMGGITASAEYLGSTICGSSLIRFLAIRACAAAFTASQILMRDSSKKVLVLTCGLVMMSTAPSSRAFIPVSVPFSVKLEMMTTGIGCWVMIFFRKVRPSIRGISTSRVITSGTSSAIFLAAK